MTINCRFCEKPMDCLMTKTGRNTDGKIVGFFTCNCKEFKENSEKMLLFENGLRSQEPKGL